MSDGEWQMSEAEAIDSLEQWVRTGWLVDGRGGPVQKDLCLGLRDGRIAAIGPARPDMKAAIDLSHATVLPALMDAHVHLVFSGTTDECLRAAQLTFTPDQARLAIISHLHDHWHCGVVAVRDGGDRQGVVLAFRAQRPVEVKATCWAWHAQGRYGAMIGRSPSAGTPPAEAIAEHLAGSDHVKLIQSGINSLDRFGDQGSPQFCEEDLRVITEAAHAARKPVMVHANGEVAVRMAIAAGCDSIEHGYFMGEENLRRMADCGVFWVPTVIPMAALAQAPGLSVTQQEVARRTVEHQLAQIHKAHKLGVAIVLGTDAGSQGVDHGPAVRQELKLLLSAGLGLEAGVRCATSQAARLLGWEDRGELVPGRRADFLVVNGPPERLPESLAEIEAMCFAGQWVKPL
ncbi:MAG: amidohydrolase family protein [Desulfatitalea sp.]